MSTIQDINALEDRIYGAVQEYLDNPEGYDKPVLHVYLDDDMKYKAEMEDNLEGTENEGYYPADDLVREGDEGKEPDIDRISDIANSWIFLD